MPDAARFRRNLIAWYRTHRRDLPWRRTRDPYRIWISEIMLQQTRAAAVIPYYERFLERFPDVAALAAAPEAELLAAWAGLGYYSRARNLQKAAKHMLDRGGFPREHEAILELPGVGNYTAAAVASIAFDLPHAVLDGNVIRVLSRVTAERGDIGANATRTRLLAEAERLLDAKRAGEFNQALMELGATVCLPKQPQCPLCPVAELCEARRQGRQREFPIKRAHVSPLRVERRLLIIERNGTVLLWLRPADSARMAGFWDLPESTQLTGARMGQPVGSFQHSIVNTNYRFEVFRASLGHAPAGFEWRSREQLHEIPLSTTAKKALACLESQGSR